MFRRLLLTGGCLMAGAQSVLAHAAVGGIEGVVRSVPHVLTEPAQFLLIFAMSLWLGQSGLSPTKGAASQLIGLGAGALGGLLLGYWPPFVVPVMLGIACLLGVLTGARLALSVPWMQVVSIPTAVLAGLACVPDPGPPAAMVASTAGAVAGAGMFSAVAFLVASWCAQGERAAPFGIALRVAGSWIAAASLMAGALALSRL